MKVSFILMNDIRKLIKSRVFSPRVDSLYAMMCDTREILLMTINDLTIEQLDYTPDDRIVESIATLLFHIAGVEWGWIFMDINKQEIDEEKWKYGFALRKEVNIDQVSGKPLDYYIDMLNEVRGQVIEYLSTIDDDILDQVIESEGRSYSIEWIIYHTFEHELTHIGQIRLLKRLYQIHHKQT